MAPVIAKQALQRVPVFGKKTCYMLGHKGCRHNQDGV